jgi:beta-glucanase (GH16 family)
MVNDLSAASRVTLPQAMDFSAGYHEFAVEWEADRLLFAVDGNTTWEVDLNR